MPKAYFAATFIHKSLRPDRFGPISSSDSSTCLHTPEVSLLVNVKSLLSLLLLVRARDSTTMRSLRLHLIIMGLHLGGTNAERLLASHYSGFVYDLSYTLPDLASDQSPQLSIAKSSKGCGIKPSWITLDVRANTAYCLDEDSSGHNELSSYSIAEGHVISPLAAPKAQGGSVHGALYGGKDGKGYLATVE